MGTSGPAKVYSLELERGEDDGGNPAAEIVEKDSILSPGPLLAVSVRRFAYFQTPSSILVYRIGPGGVLVGPRSSPIANVGAIAIDENRDLAYLLTADDDGNVPLVVAKINPSNGKLRVLSTIPTGNDKESGEYFDSLVVEPLYDMLYAPSRVSVGQFKLSDEGRTVTKHPPVAIPGVNVLTTGCDQLRPKLVVDVRTHTAVALHQKGAPTGACTGRTTELQRFAIDPTTGLLSLAAATPLVTARAESTPGALEISPDLPWLARYVYASDKGFTFDVSSCTGAGNVTTKVLAETGAQQVAGFRSGMTLDLADSATVNEWVGPTTIGCVAPIECVSHAMAGEVSPTGVALATSPTGRLLAVGNPGLVRATVSDPPGGNVCFPVSTSVAENATLEVHGLDTEGRASTGALGKLATTSLGGNQVPATILAVPAFVERFASPIELLPHPTLDLPGGGLLEPTITYGPLPGTSVLLPEPDQANTVVRIGAYRFVLKRRHVVKSVVGEHTFYDYHRTIDGITVQARFRKLRQGRYRLRMSVQPLAGLRQLGDPTDLTLVAGEFGGWAEVTPTRP